MLQVADENAVVYSRPFKFGACDGLRGVKDAGRSAFGKPPFKLTVGKPQNQQKARAALSDLTNAMKGASFGSAKPGQASARAVSEPPMEQLAGKGWQAMEKDVLQQTEVELQQRLGRIAAAAGTWTTSHMCHEELSSDEDDSIGSLNERFSESPIVVQLLAPRHTQGVTMPQPCSGFDTELYNMLPDVSPAPLEIEFCWIEDEH